MINVINKHAPYRTLTKSELAWKKKPWIDKKLQRLIAKKNKLHHKFIKGRDPFWYNRYTSLKKVVRTHLFQAKKAYYTDYFEYNANNSKKIWSGINDLYSKRKNCESGSIFLNENGQIVYRPKECCYQNKQIFY